jgi:hypothetical protein
MILPYEIIQAYRARAFRSTHELRLQDVEQAVEFVNERGFIFFWPIRGYDLPSLWAAVAGNRPVADEHDDPGHITWGWKDSMLSKRRWYYAKVVRKKATLISLETAPYFYALSENYGSPDEDYLTLYEQGRLTQEAKSIYETLLREGALDTPALRRAARLSAAESEGRFNKALTDLQADFKVLPVGITDAGAWHYAFAYDLTHRHFPELPEQAQAIRESAARGHLAGLYFQAMGASPLRELNRLFGWREPAIRKALEDLIQAGTLTKVEVENHPGEWLAHTNLMS